MFGRTCNGIWQLDGCIDVGMYVSGDEGEGKGKEGLC